MQNISKIFDLDVYYDLNLVKVLQCSTFESKILDFIWTVIS